MSPPTKSRGRTVMGKCRDFARLRCDGWHSFFTLPITLRRRFLNWLELLPIAYLRRTAPQAGTPLLADCADNAALRPRIVGGELVLVREHFIVLRHRREFALRHHVHHGYP